MTRLAVFAYSGTGHACLKLLLDRGERIVFLATHRDDPAEKRWFPSVADLARSGGIEPVIVENPLDPQWTTRLRVAGPDLLLSFYYRRVLPDEMLAVPRLGAFNMHGSLLPKFRGRAPVNWAVLKGETRTGATLHAMTRRADAGPIVDQEAVPIGPEDTAFDVQKRVDAAAVAILARRLEELKAGTAPSKPQDEAAATRFGRRRPEDGRIDWSRPAREVHDLVRAVTHPFPGAFTELFGPKTYVWRTRLPGLAAHDTFPGQVRAEESRLHVACGDDRYVEILSLQNDGAPEMDAASWLAATAPSKGHA
jgi:methionyl-tRNA formyltransferase